MSDPKRLIDGRGLGRTLLESGRETGPAAAESDALWARLDAELALGAVLASGQAMKPPAAGVATGSVNVGLAATIAKGALVLLAASIVAGAALRPHVLVRAVQVEERAPSVPARDVDFQLAAPGQTTSFPMEAPGKAEGPEPPRPVVTRPVTAPTPSLSMPATPSERTARTTEEVSESALLLAARRAVRARDCQAALASLATAAERFPDGALAEERELLGIRALECAGRIDEAFERRIAFERVHPSSAYLPRATTSPSPPEAPTSSTLLR